MAVSGLEAEERRFLERMRLEQEKREAEKNIDVMRLGGYKVKIIGGDLSTTKKGEHYVKMKSGTQYQIWAANDNPYGCHLDITIDGYKVGTWILHAMETIALERPAGIAKRFTFYRVATAPREAGIESGRKENGVIKCVFTPDKEGLEAEKRRDLERMRLEQEEREAEKKAMERKERRIRLEQEILEAKKRMDFERIREAAKVLEAMEREERNRLEQQAKKQVLYLREEQSHGYFGGPMEILHEPRIIAEPDPAWRSGATTFQGQSSQQFVTAEPLKLELSAKVVIVVRLVAREDERDLRFPTGDFTPLSTAYARPVPD